MKQESLAFRRERFKATNTQPLTQPHAIGGPPPSVGRVAVRTTYRFIPTEIWEEIARYISDYPQKTLGKLLVAGHSRPARLLRGRIYFRTIAQISGNPIVQFLMEKTNLLREKRAEEQVRVLDECLRHGNSWKRISEEATGPEDEDRKLLEARREEFDETAFLRKPRDLIDRYSDCSLWHAFMYLVGKGDPALFDL